MASLYVIIAVGILVYALFIEEKLSFRAVIYYPFICAAFFLGLIFYNYRLSSYQNFANNIKYKNCTLLTVIESIDKLHEKKWRYRITGTVKALSFANVTQKTMITVQLYTHIKPMFKVGDLVNINNLVYRPPTQKEFALYLIKEKIGATFFCKSLIYKLEHRPKYSFKRWCAHTKKRIIKKLRTQLSPYAFSLCSSLFLGYKEVDKQSLQIIKEDFKLWGISHYLARSGLHVMTLIYLWYTVLQLLPLPYFLKEFLIFIFVLLYTLLSWSSVSFLRAFITFIAYKVCILAHLQIRPLHVLTLVCLYVLITNPLQLLYLDFQLSFGITASLLWFSELQQTIDK